MLKEWGISRKEIIAAAALSIAAFPIIWIAGYSLIVILRALEKIIGGL